MGAIPFTIGVSSMLRKTMVVFAFLLLLLSSLPVVAADIGPKPSTRITVVGIGGDYELELLIPNPYSIPPAPLSDATMAEKEYDDHGVLRFLNGYIDADGYVSWRLYTYAPTSIDRSAEPDDQGCYSYMTGYYSSPPTYKVFILTENDVAYVSESVTPAAFYSVVTVDFTNVPGVDVTVPDPVILDTGEVEETIAYDAMLVEFAIRLLLTVGIELFVLFVFGYRKRRSYLIALAVNGVSLTLMTAGVVIVSHLFPVGAYVLAMLLFIEAFVFAAEMLIYAKWLRERSQPWPVLYGLAANLATLSVTFLWIFLDLGVR